MKIPFELLNGIILLDVSVNGKSGKMAFDTGAMQTCLNSSHFKDFKGERKEVSKFDGAVKTETTVKGKCDIRCREWNLTDIPVILLDMDYVEKPLKGVCSDLIFLGTMGIDLIRSHKVLLHYAASELILDEEFSVPAEIYEMHTDILPVVDVCIGEENYKFVLDTGANTCMLEDSFKQKDFLAGNAASSVVQIPKMTALGKEYSDVMAVITDMSAIQSKLPVSGVIGYQILKDGISYFDFEAGKIFIGRKKKGHLEYNPDRTRLSLDFSPKATKKTSEENKRRKTEENYIAIRKYLQQHGLFKTVDIAAAIELSPARTRVLLKEIPGVYFEGTNTNRKYYLIEE